MVSACFEFNDDDFESESNELELACLDDELLYSILEALD